MEARAIAGGPSPAAGPIRTGLHDLRRTDTAELTVAAWGNMGWIHGRDAAVSAGRQLHYLRLTASGAPGHPLYLPATLTPQPWSPSP